jgi:hypothetical protein
VFYYHVSQRLNRPAPGCRALVGPCHVLGTLRSPKDIFVRVRQIFSELDTTLYICNSYITEYYISEHWGLSPLKVLFASDAQHVYSRFDHVRTY